MSIALAVLAIVLGGILKGAIGAGVPVVAAPAITMLYDVQTAVAVLVVPNLLSNLWQARTYRRSALPARFLVLFAGGGMVGVVAGTVLLAWLPPEALSLLVALAVYAFIGLRLARPGWVLPRPLAERLSGPAGALGGLLQGATGISAPVSMSFLAAMRLPREAFIGTISIFFVTMTAVQIPTLLGVGLLSLHALGLGLAAMGLVVLSMPLGNWLGRRTAPHVFDWAMIVVLGVIATRILVEAAL